jgi:CHAT domain-containing protein/tetratricopeptide (TPR) repeat protein
VLGHLGNVALRTGELDRALEHYSDVLANARRTGDRGLENSALFALARAGYRLGDLDLALQRTEEALRSLGSEGPPAQRAQLLCFLALVLQGRGDLETPGAKLATALELARRANDRLLESTVLAGQVALAHDRSEYVQALAPAREMLAIGRELGFPDVEASGLRNLAELHLRLGEVERAHELAEQATALFRRIGDRRELQSALLTAVEIADLREDTQAMRAIVSEAEACFLDAPRLDPERAALLRSREVFSLWGEHAQDLVARILASSSSPSVEREAIEEGFRRAGTWKGRALWDGIAEHRRGARNARSVALRREHDDVLAARESVLLSLRDALREDAPGERLAELRAQLDDLERRSAAIAGSIGTLSPADAALDTFEGSSPAQLAGIIEGRALIEFVEGRHDLYAYVLVDGRLDFHEIGPRSAIDARVQAFLDGISRRDTLAAPELVARRGRELHDLLIGAPLREVAPSTALVVVPSASLAGLPLEALVVEAPERPAGFVEVAFVLDRREVTYAASTPVLALLTAAEPRSTPGRALVLGDPLSGDEGARVAGQAFERLLGTRHEALAIAAALEQRAATGGSPVPAVGGERSLSLQGRTVSLRLGADATPECLAGDLRVYSVLHCASHGWLDRDDPRRSGLVLSPDRDGKALVSLTDILDLDLDLDLAVLSACDTARGAVQRGEGVRSLATAFQYAGARSVVASLWPVEDLATQQVMVAFHRANPDGGATVSHALRDARLAVRHGSVTDGELRGRPVLTSRSSAADAAGHPYDWAPFVLSGPPRATVTAR